MSPDSALLQEDLAARVAALDVGRSFIVQAPAGSGKTELLIQRYLKLLATVDEPEQVLAITFTVKATAEMRARVIAALRRAEQGIAPEEPHLALTFELARAVQQRSAELGWRLAENPGRMRIQTLDALNAAIARTRTLSAGGVVSGSILDEAGMRTMYRAAALATLDWLAEDGELAAATRRVLQHLDISTTAYVGHLEEMLASRDHWLPFIGSGVLDDAQADELRQRFETNLRGAIGGYLQRVAYAMRPFDDVATVFDGAAQALRDNGDFDSPILALGEHDGLPPARAVAVEAWQGLAELLLTKSTPPTFRKRVDVRQGFPPANKAAKEYLHAMLEALAPAEELARLLGGVRDLPRPRFSDEQWQVLRALFRLLPVAVSELQRLFAADGSTDHTEVALQAAEALGQADSPGEVALLLDHQIRHILVDEMQDTSAAQYAMLEALTAGWQAGDGRSLFCVGDPMQSIYRFRNAEVGRFVTAFAEGIGDLPIEALRLRRNFRSGSRLVDWYNAVFPGVMGERDDVAFGAVGYSASTAAEHLAGRGEIVVHPVIGPRREDEARMVRSTIEKLRGIAPDETLAVLVRSRSHLPALLVELRAHGIAYSSVEIDRLTDLPEIIDVLALTRAAAHPGDRIAWLGVLRAPWIGLSWTDLHRLVHSDRRRTVLSLLRDDDRIAQLSEDAATALRRAQPLLEALVAPDGVRTLRDRVETCWLRLGGPATLAEAAAADNVYRFLDLVERLESRGSLADVAMLEAQLDDERVSSSGDPRLQIMTMHKAKGLEFDHVILPGLGRGTRADTRAVLSWLEMPDRDGEAGLVIGPLAPRADSDKDPVQGFIAMAARIKSDNETSRLLYVACTRAMQSLHLVGHVGVDEKTGSIRKPPAGSLLRALWPLVEPEYLAAAADSGAVTTERADIEPLWLLPKRRRFGEAWQLPEVRRPVVLGERQVATGEDGDRVEFYWVGADAPVAGTLVHRWLHRIACGRATLDQDVAERRAITRRWLREMGHADDSGDAILARVEAALSAMLGDPTGRWLLEADGHAELALSGSFEGDLVSVVLDRVCVDDDGTHWLVDYKTSSHEGGNLQGFLDAELARYRGQLERYAALYTAYAGVRPRCALYFPLLRQFVELQPVQ